MNQVAPGRSPGIPQKRDSRRDEESAGRARGYLHSWALVGARMGLSVEHSGALRCAPLRVTPDFIMVGIDMEKWPDGPQILE